LCADSEIDLDTLCQKAASLLHCEVDDDWTKAIKDALERLEALALVSRQ